MISLQIKALTVVAIVLLVSPVYTRPSAYNTDPVCSLPAEVGRCYAYFEKYYFNGSSCELFIYGGCGGNANKFDDKEECEATCGS